MSEIAALPRREAGSLREPPSQALPDAKDERERLGNVASLTGLSRLTPTVCLRSSGSTPMLFPERRDEPAAEQYRILRTRVVQHSRSPTVIAISSAGIGDGKTITSINLAGVLALKNDEQVLLLDADLRRSTTHAFFEIEGAPGLADVLEGRCQLQEVVLQVASQKGLYFLPPGDPRKNPAELFDSRQWPEIAGQLRQRFGWIIVDCPPVEAIADYDLITAECDRIILVVRPDHTRRQALANALKRTSEKLLGLVLNDAREWLFWKRPDFSEYTHSDKQRN